MRKLMLVLRGIVVSGKPFDPNHISVRPASSEKELWNSTSRNEVANAFINDYKSNHGGQHPKSNYDCIILVLQGQDENSYIAWANSSNRLIFIYSTTTHPYAVSHEIGHLYGLNDLYSTNSNQHYPGADLANLMNCATTLSAIQYRLRKSQWDIQVLH